MITQNSDTISLLWCGPQLHNKFSLEVSDEIFVKISLIHVHNNIQIQSLLSKCVWKNNEMH